VLVLVLVLECRREKIDHEQEHDYEAGEQTRR
jgi:hypothetical protein